MTTTAYDKATESMLLYKLVQNYANFLENTKNYTTSLSEGEPDKLLGNKLKGPNIIEDDIATDLEEVSKRIGHLNYKWIQMFTH